MVKKLAIYLVGVLTGFIPFLFNSVINIEKDNILKGGNYSYIILQSDYTIENNGTLKKGTKLRLDREMEEGFTRYILYLNHKQGERDQYTLEMSDMIIPYWLQQLEETKKHE